MRKQRIILEDHAETAIFRLQLVHATIIDKDTTSRRTKKTGNAIESRRFSAAGRAEKRDELAFPDSEVDFPQRIESSE